MSDRVAVMYLGKFMEVADKDTIYNSPRYPYTHHLTSAISVPDPEFEKEEVLLTGDVPSLVDIPPGRRFNPRCPYATDKCKSKEPLLTEKTYVGLLATTTQILRVVSLGLDQKEKREEQLNFERLHCSGCSHANDDTASVCNIPAHFARSVTHHINYLT
jgi:oligopeptide/dipeptide ABC transporter ATP-binding protein